MKRSTTDTIDYTNRVAVEEAFPLYSFVRFNDLSGAVGKIVGYRTIGSDVVLKIAIVGGELRNADWHPGNVTRVKRVDAWEPIA